MNKDSKTLEKLTMQLVGSILRANKKLEQEVQKTRNELDGKRKVSLALQDKESIKKLEERVAKLENLKVEAKLVE